ncbi:hypothetical protein PISMIDRAFT_539212 [Pisolithus microcarpus 441]|uniref:Uncharacterized protein n=1 Tax=Pisolithus microcarpus 441 TaxID=765257 RepID=A0A0C9ZG74_9AGAM|nr:hypothetical protein PISMIDRAFT_539212 [Pisolithus microcarpus 441]
MAARNLRAVARIVRVVIEVAQATFVIQNSDSDHVTLPAAHVFSYGRNRNLNCPMPQNARDIIPGPDIPWNGCIEGVNDVANEQESSASI